MSKKLAKATFLTLLCMLLVTIPILMACGSGNGGAMARPEIRYGWLWDFTGRAAVGTTGTLQGMKDYIRMVEESEPLPLRINIITYDGRSDASRLMPGYMWLKGQGADIMSAAPHDVEALRSRFEQDKMPFFSLPNQMSTIDSQWLTSLFGPPESQIEVIMQYIEDDWGEQYPTKPKVAFVGLAGIPFYTAQLTMTMKMIDENPTKFEWIGSQMAPVTTTAWASEILKIKGADYVITAMSGPPCASFMMESKQRGHTGTFIGPMESYLAFWLLMKSAVSEDTLDGIMTGHWTVWWSDDSPLMKEIKHYAAKYHPDESKLWEMHQGTGQFNGWLAGMILVDAVKRAAARVGAENVTGIELHKALQETNLTVEGLAEPLKLYPGSNCFVRSVFLMEYQAAVADWVRVTEPVVPPTLAG